MDRDRIFAEIRKAVATRDESARAPLPDLPTDQFVSKKRMQDGEDWQTFQRHFEAVNGDFISSASDLLKLFEREAITSCYCPEELLPHIQSVLPETVKIHTTYEREKVDEYQAGFTMASYAIAETGTIILEDKATPNRMGALAPWAHIALVPKTALLPTVVSAIEKLSDDPNIIWVTGPSKTADVEGILIEGVHGPGIQGCWPID